MHWRQREFFIERSVVQPNDLLTGSGPSASVRLLKIEADGDTWKRLIKPKIRLMGRWLERAGFRPGHHVQVTCVSPGVIELRSPNAMEARTAEQRLLEEAKIRANGFDCNTASHNRSAF
jgi:hypothetical protein